jgi:multimeric flavodoxin WrbA
MKITVVVGTCQKNGTGMHHLAEIEKTIKSTYNAEFEYLFLGDYNLQTCRGCTLCYERGEENCPLKDGFLQAMRILDNADEAIFYSPTYTLSISGLLKTFFDRSSYVLHRPYFKGRYALLLSTTLLMGEKEALRTMDTIVSKMGFTIAGKIGIVNEKYTKQPSYKKKT